MGIRKFNSTLVVAIMGLTMVSLGFQNCTRARFVVDERAKQKALGEGVVFDQGDDGMVPDGNITGDDPNIPNFPGMGNEPGTPAGPGPGIVSIVPTPVCSPFIPTGQSMLPKTSNVVAVLYRSADFSKETPAVVQAWNSPADTASLRAQLDSGTPLKLNLSSPLPPGTYSVVLYDASKVQPPYSYNRTNATNVLAPIDDEYVEHIDSDSTFVVSSDGSVKVPQILNLLVGQDGEPICDSAGSIDPLLIQLKTTTPQLISLSSPDKGVLFDLLGGLLNHKQVLTSWFVSSKTENYFLALPNAAGKVNGADELFGDATLGPDGRYAPQGFAALAKHDDTRDRLISEDDSVYSKLRLWKDDNLDGLAQNTELHTLESKGVEVIDLRFDPRYQEIDQYGNITKYKSIVIMKDGQYGLVYDLYLRFINK